MPQDVTPRVCVEDNQRGPRPIDGVPTSIAAFLGDAERGTTTPRLITSYTEYKHWFGDIFGSRDRYLPYAANAFFENGGRQLYVCRLTRASSVRASLDLGSYILKATGGGVWGNRIYATFAASETQRPHSNDPTKSLPLVFSVRLAYWSDNIEGQIPYDPFSGDSAESPNNAARATLIEIFEDLVTEPTSADYWGIRLNGNSALAEVELKTTGKATDLPSFNTGLFTGGSDGQGSIDFSDYQGDTSGNPPRDEPQGLAALDLGRYRDVSLVYAPSPPDSRRVTLEIIRHCEEKRFRFAVVDPDSGTDDTSKLDPRILFTDTQYAAFYFPWVYIPDPQNGTTKLVPPGGYALGVMARTDSQRGVFKAPANEIVQDIVGLEFKVSADKQGLLHQQGCNVIRDFPSGGIRVWGARTMSADPIWKYISVRRFLIFLERSIYEGTQWVVFEPNNDKLWDRVKDSIRLFLRTLWRDGALFGRTEEEAFFVSCDLTTMTQADILNGQLICEIGVAVVQPAEFIIFRIFQATAESGIGKE